jgi:hypothetical protein
MDFLTLAVLVVLVLLLVLAVSPRVSFKETPTIGSILISIAIVAAMWWLFGRKA